MKKILAWIVYGIGFAIMALPLLCVIVASMIVYLFVITARWADLQIAYDGSEAARQADRLR